MRLYDWYKKLWTKLGGRPWTFILRDVYHQTEYFAIIVIAVTCFWLGTVWDWETFGISCGMFTAGYICGHLFWGKEYKKDQEGK